MSYREKNMCTKLRNLLEKYESKDFKDMQIVEEFALDFCNEFDIITNNVPIVSIAQQLGFKIYVSIMNNRNISGLLSVDERYMSKYGTDKIIKINKVDSIQHKRFTIAHEIAHYIFDYKGGDFASVFYITDDEHNSHIEEQRANRFAAAILMKKDVFIDMFNAYKKEYNNHYELINCLAEKFNVSQKAVSLRIEELNLS